GYLGAVLGSRLDLVGQGDRARRLVLTAALGGGAVAAILLLAPERVFELLVPFLVLGASATLAFQDQLRALVGHPETGSRRRRTVALHLVVGLASIYGGYFGAALGVLLVALIALVVAETMARVSALKNLVSAVVGLITVVVFAVFGPVEWLAALVLAPATVIGGYVGARTARKLPHGLWKGLIAGFGTLIGVILLLQAFTLISGPPTQ